MIAMDMVIFTPVSVKILPKPTTRTTLIKIHIPSAITMRMTSGLEMSEFRARTKSRIENNSRPMPSPRNVHTPQPPGDKNRILANGDARNSAPTWAATEFSKQHGGETTIWEINTGHRMGAYGSRRDLNNFIDRTKKWLLK